MRTSRVFVAVCVAIGLAVAFAAPTLANDGPPVYYPCDTGHKKNCPTTTTTAPEPETTTTTTVVPEETTTTTIPGPPVEPETPLPVDELPETPLPATPIVAAPDVTG